MKTLLCYVLVILSGSTALAQATLETVKKSRIIKNEITLRIKSTNSIDFFMDHETSAKTLDTVDYFEIKDREFRVNIEFINPLQYRISSENKEIDDELYQASNEYLTNAISFFQTVGASQKAISGAALRGAPPTATEGSKTYMFSDPQLAELYVLVKLWNNSIFNAQDSLLTAMENLKFEATKEQVLKKVDDTFNTLINIRTIEAIRGGLEKNDTMWGKINDDLNHLSGRFDKVSINFAGLSTADKNLRNTINFRLNTLKKEMDAFRESIGEIKLKYGAIKTLFDDLANKQSSGNNFVLASVQNIKSSKRHELKIYLQQVAFNMTDKTVKLSDKKTYVLNIRKYALLIPVVSSGILYSNLTFTRFGTSTDSLGRTIVSKADEDAKELVTGAYLNLFFNTKSEHMLFLQVGAGPTSDKPVLFLGGGFSLGNRLNLSFGTVFTWFPELADLKPGDEVKGTAEIEKATHYRFDTTPKFYVGLNINLTN